MLVPKTKVAYALFLFSFTIWFALVWTALSPTFTAGNQIQLLNPALLAVFAGSAFTASIGCLLIGVHYLGWQEIEGLQKKQAELDVSAVEKEHNSLERMATVMEGVKIQEEHIRKLEAQINELNEKNEAVSKLECRIAELENTLKKQVKEPAKEEPEKQPREEPEKQPVEVTVLAEPEKQPVEVTALAVSVRAAESPLVTPSVAEN
jgi:hypothetical protein